MSTRSRLILPSVHVRATLTLALAASFISVAPAPAATTTLVELGSNWRFLDDGSDQGSAWQQTGFNDSTWSTGAAELGYGDGDETTVVSFGPDSSDKFVTTYFRQTFQATNVGQYTALTLRLRRDDGAVVYLNGSEVARSNMPGGTVSFTTLASATVSGADESALNSFSIAPSLLTEGTNVLAVEIHQRSGSSSDISFDLELLASDGGANVVRGPYLQRGSADSVVVRWRTDVATDSRVRFGTDLANLDQLADDPTNTTEHAVAVSGLIAGTTYFYSVGTSAAVLAGGDADHVFGSAPATGTSRSTRIWALGDSGTADANARAVRDGFESFTGSRDPDLWLMLGDNAYEDGTDSEYQAAVFDTYPDQLRKSVVWPTLGNHDSRSADSPSQSGVYYDIFSLPAAAQAGGVPSGTEAYYSFDYGNIHFICLDSDDTDRSPSGAMLTWLEDDLIATNARWIIAFWHHPPYSKGSHDSDSEGRLVDMRANALPILEANGVDLVLGGHSHSYERSFLIDGHYGSSGTFSAAQHLVDGGDGQSSGDGAYQKADQATRAGAVYIVAGNSGRGLNSVSQHPAMFTFGSFFGSMVIDVEDDSLEAFMINTSGSAVDSFTITKSGGCTPQAIADAGADRAITEGESVSIGTPALGGHAYSWSPGGATSAQISVAPSTTMAYTVTATTSCGSAQDSVTVTVTPAGGGGPQNAEFNAGLGVPACLVAGSSCDTLALLDGVADAGPEPNQPNTLDGCADGASGSYHSDESNDRLVVSTLDGSDMVEGGTVRIDATVWAWTTPAEDTLDLYFAGDANSPSWTLVTSITPTVAGEQTVSATYTLPVGGLQAVRANFRYQGSASPCSTGGFDDHDDLVFAVGSAAGCTSDPDCDDGAFCNGTESCNVGTGVCQAGTPVSCDDGVSCTIDSCNQGSDSCDNAPDDGVCDNGLFCDGAETCDTVNDCQAGSDPCSASQTCDEGADLCVGTGGCLHEVDFESGAGGWTGDTGSCSTGDFIVGTPDSTAWQLGAGNPGQAFFTANNPNGIGGDDVDGGTCVALSPTLDASGEAAISVSLDYFHGQRDAADDAGDGFTIEVLNNGSVVGTLANIGDVTHNPAWTRVQTTLVDPGSIQLRVQATDAAGGGDIVEGGIDNVQVCPTTPPAPCSVEEDFAGGLSGWLNTGASTCATGTFVAATPTQQTSTVVTQVGGDHTTGSGNAVFTATNTAAGNADVDGGNCVLESPVFSVTEASDLSIWYFHGQRDAGDDGAGDFFRLEVSTDGGGSYTPLVFLGDVQNVAAWTEATTTIPAGSDVRLRVQVSDGGAAGDIVEGGIDDLSICSQ